ncbi:MAG: hypothetical protein IPM35_04300 [Myxococcales bacterium]|nr:hypothetical protein [Myxococcales bacterium]
MTQCPEVDVLLARQASAEEHAVACAACSAVLSLAELRDERSASRGDACVEAEVLLALQSEDLLDAEQVAELATHLESCAECSEVAVRVQSSAGAVADEIASAAGAEAPARRSFGLVLGIAAALCAGAALGVLALRARPRPAETPVSEAPRAAAPAPGLGLEPPVLAPSVAPAAAPSVAPLAPSPPAPKPVPTLVDPWATSAPKPPATSQPPPPVQGTGFLTVMCVPTCDSVLAQGKNLGASPVVRAPLPSGPVNLELRRGAIKRFLRVQIVAGQTTARRVSMNPEPEVMDPWR